MDILSLIVGLALLVGGGELLMRGALSAADSLGISPLLSGLVIVGFGTSMPELIVSLQAALGGQPDIAVGNVVGSDIANVLLILGLCALITPMLVQPLSLRRDGMVFLIASGLFIIFSRDGVIATTEGGLLFSGLLGYLIWAYFSEQGTTTPEAELHVAEANEVAIRPGRGMWTAASIFAGLALLIGGAQLMLAGAVGIAAQLGVSEAVIGLTLVAVGTSLPELSISVIAAIRGHAAVAVGNVLGSNIFNLLGILGISALLQPLPVISRIQQFDQWVLLAVAAILMLFMFTGRRLNRIEGFVFLAAYMVYLFSSFYYFS